MRNEVVSALTTLLFSESDNAGLDKKSLADLWMFCIPFLEDLVRPGYFPQPSVLHSVAYVGMKGYRAQSVRNICHGYLQTLLQHHPPTNNHLRRQYLHLFSIKDGNENEPKGNAWDGFSTTLEDFLTTAIPSDGDLKLVEFLVAVIEHDFHHWLDR